MHSQAPPVPQYLLQLLLSLNRLVVGVNIGDFFFLSHIAVSLPLLKLGVASWKLLWYYLRLQVTFGVCPIVVLLIGNGDCGGLVLH